MNRSGIPPGWDYNPSSWLRRTPVLLGCLAGLAILSAAPAHIATRSSFLFFFATFFVAESIGGMRRWRAHPWTVGLSVLCLTTALWGLGLCVLNSASPRAPDVALAEIAASVLAVLMIGPLAGELLASLQFLKRLHRQRRSIWRAFWGLDPRRTRSAGHWHSKSSEAEP